MRSILPALGMLSILAGAPRGIYFEGEGTSGGGGAAPPPAPAPTAPPPAKTYTEAEFTALNTRLAALETENTTFKGKITEFETSQLTEQQKIEAKAADAETKREEAQKVADARADELKQERLERMVEREAGSLKVIDPDAALRLLDLSKIEYDDAGKPKNVKALLEALVAAKPYLVGTSAPSTGLPVGNARQGTGGTKTAIDIINEQFAARRGAGRGDGFRLA